MNENAVKIQIALSALERVNVPATAENVNSLTVVWQMLQQVKADLAQAAPAGGSGQEVPPDGVTVRFEEDEDGKPETE